MTGIQIRGDRLRSLRHSMRLSGTGLGERIGRTCVQVYRVEKGACGTSLETLDRLAAVFGPDAVADLIVDPEQRSVFLAAHREHA